MAKVAVVVNCYNSAPIMKQCLNALFTKSSSNVSVILNDNHSPDQASRDYLRSSALQAAFRDITVLDSGRNLGAHNGWNYGFEHGVVDKGFDYVVKLDDDTCITTPNWDKLMVEGLELWPEVAFISADGTASSKQMDNFEVREIEGLIYEVPPRNIVDFHCVMFRVPEMMNWERNTPGSSGGYSGRVWMTNPEGDGDKRLYGGEELYMARKARNELRPIAYFRNVFCNHIGNEERCQDYQLWKFVYGICRWTDKPVDEWRESGEMLRDLRRLIGNWALNQEGWARPYIVECVQRVGDIGELRDAGALLLVAHGNPEGFGTYKPRTDMPEVLAECDKASEKLRAKFGVAQMKG